MNHLPRDIVLMETKFLFKATDKVTCGNTRAAQHFFPGAVGLKNLGSIFLALRHF